MKNLDTLIPTVSALVAELANIKPVTGKKAQSKRNLNFVLMVTAGKMNRLAETVNFLC